MKAIRVHEAGDAGVLQIEDVPDPRPGAGEALARIEAAGVNFIEIYQRKGLYPMTRPYTPGSEGAGEVVAVGEGVTSPRVGERVVSGVSTPSAGAGRSCCTASPADRCRR